MTAIRGEVPATRSTRGRPAVDRFSSPLAITEGRAKESVGQGAVQPITK